MASREQRSSNIELLRVLSMLALVMHHFLAHGGLSGMEMSTNRVISYILLPAGKICFISFVAISCWFLVNSSFKGERFVKIWLQVFFYNVLFTWAALQLSNSEHSVSIAAFIGALFPMTGNSHGFAAAYLWFYLLLPVLKKITIGLSKRATQYILFILGATQIFVPVLGSLVSWTQYLQSELLIFVFCYFVAYYMHNWPLRFQNHIGVLLAIFVSFTAFAVITNVLFLFNTNGNLLVRIARTVCAGGEFSIINIIAGFSLFLIFLNLPIPQIKWVNVLASTTFGILLFHDHNVFRPFVWQNLKNMQDWAHISAFTFVGYLLVITVGVYLVGMVIDFVRQLFFEKVLLEDRLAKYIGNKLDRITAELFQVKKDEKKTLLETEPVSKKCGILDNSNNYSNGPSLSVNATYGRVFSIAVLISVGVYWLIMFATRSQNIDAYFVTDHTNTAMDYFNMLANLNQSDPWHANANYPAICFLFWKVMHRFLPIADYADGYTLRENMIAQLGYFLFVFICMIIIWEVIKHIAKNNQSEKILFACALLFSGPMFFLLERGNILLAVLAFSLLFLALYDSDKFWYRVIAYIALSIASAIKLYPAVLGLLVLWKKRYKEAALLVVLGAFTFLAPFFAFDGIDSLIKMVKGVAYATEVQTGRGLGCNFCLSNLVQMIAAMFGYNLVTVPGWVPIAGAIGCIVLYFISKYEWQKLYALVLLCIWFPTFSYTYALVLLFLPILSFFFRNENKDNKNLTVIYTVAFVLMVIPYALPMADGINNALQLEFIKWPTSWGMVIINLTMLFVAVMVAAENIMRIIKNRNQRTAG